MFVFVETDLKHRASRDLRTRVTLRTGENSYIGTAFPSTVKKNTHFYFTSHLASGNFVNKWDQDFLKMERNKRMF